MAGSTAASGKTKKPFGGSWHTREATLALGLATALLALLAALSLLQLTAPGPAHRALRRAVASLTEIDSLLAARGPALREQANASPDEPLTLPDYPLNVTLSSQETQQPASEVRDLLLDRSAERVYQEGTAAFRQGDQTGHSSRLSVLGAVRTGLEFLTAGHHDALRWTTIALGILCGALSGVLLFNTPGYRRLVTLGGVVATASMLFLLLTALVRQILAVAGWATDDYITGQLLDLAKGTAWLPFRDGLAFGGLGLALLALGLLGWRLSEPPTA
jgi:hypothetical protein